VSKFDRPEPRCSLHFGVVTKRVPFIVAQLGRNLDRFMLHIYAALAEKERAMISERTRPSSAACGAWDVISLTDKKSVLRHLHEQ
jgi:hypothetical protein